MQTKVCNKCGEEKSIDSYYKQKEGKFGVRGTCKVCDNVRLKRYREENKSIIKERQKLWHKNNPDYFKEVYWRNPERYRNYRKTYYYKNRDSEIQKRGEWRKNNREKDRESLKRCYYKDGRGPAYGAERRAKRRQATPDWLCEDLKAQIKEIYYSCPEGYHVDHIIPLKGKTVCGLHVPWNLQYLPPEENVSKGNRWWPDMWEEVDDET